MTEQESPMYLNGKGQWELREEELSPEAQIIHLVFEFTKVFISEEEAKQFFALIKEAGYVKLAEDQQVGEK